jgi:hypothetical protein
VTTDEVFEAWAPDGSPWRPWVKPVLFAYAAQVVEVRALEPEPAWPRAWIAADTGPLYRDSPALDTAVVVDLPGSEGVRIGLALAAVGFRPVPLYNAIPAHDALVPAWEIVHALVAGASRLGDLPALAPPAFLLDAGRGGPAHRPRGRAYFDNRSICRDTDFPSAALLASNGIRRVVLVQRGRVPAPDLEPVLYAWQRAGLSLALVDGGPAVAFEARRRLVASALRAARAWLRDNRNDDGSFGSFHVQVTYRESSAG